MKTNRGYIVAMYKPTNKVVTISLEIWNFIENIDDYKPLYRADDKKDAENYVKEISSNIQKEPTMVNKQEFIEKACEWLLKGGYFVNNNETIEDFRKAMEE